MQFKTEQESFWHGDFGSGYMERNALIEDSIRSRLLLWSKVIDKTGPIDSIFEFGSNVGLNLAAFQRISTRFALNAIEINSIAAEQSSQFTQNPVINSSILEATKEQIGRHDMTFSSCVLIHIQPEKLGTVYDLLYACSNRYIVINEYYSPKPVEIEYRGHHGRLFKRDFAGDMLDRYPDLKLVDYRFHYHRDPVAPLDDFTWFLLEKTAG